MRRFGIYAAVIIGALLAITTALAWATNPDTFADTLCQHVWFLMLIGAGVITFLLRRRGASEAKAFATPLLIEALITLVLFMADGISPDNQHLAPMWFFFAIMLVPMVVVCGLVTRLTKPRDFPPEKP